jgi:hypothetical protein
MRDYKVYVCEKCGEEFPDDREKCAEHEKYHVRPEPYGIHDKGSYQSGDKYPVFIIIPMADGANVRYRVEGVLTPPEEPETKESPLATANSTED